MQRERFNAQQDLINNLNLEDNIKFIGYSSFPEIFFNNVSLTIYFHKIYQININYKH